MGEQVIRCTVSSCYYYASGDRCRASTIMVTHNPATMAGDPRAEFATELGQRAAATSAHTQCQTFVPKDRGPKEGVRRLPD